MNSGGMQHTINGLGIGLHKGVLLVTCCEDSCFKPSGATGIAYSKGFEDAGMLS